MNARFFLQLFFILVFFGCSQKNPSPDIPDELVKMEKQYRSDKADSTFVKLVQAYGKNIMESESMPAKEQLLRKVITLCSEFKNTAYTEVFETELLKVNPRASDAKKLLENTAMRMEDKNRPELASIFYSALEDRFGQKDKYRYKIIAEQSDMQQYMKSGAEDVFRSPGPQGVNIEASEKYIDLCEAFALSFPEDRMSPEYLFRASEIARAINSLPKAMSLYDWIIQYYPKSDKTASVLFMKGFILDSELSRKEEAKKVYNNFLEKYPGDSLANDVKFLLDNLGKSDQEIIKGLENK